MECTLYLTDYCNLKCSYCYLGDEKNLNFLDRDKLEKSIDFIIKNNTEGEKIYLTFLGGEPLLNKDLIYEAVNIINNKYSKYSDLFKYRITTNCTLIDDEIIKFFEDNKFNVRVSIDGDEYTHNLNRISINKSISYETILNNIKKIQKSNIEYSIRMTISENTIELLYKNILYFYNLGIKSYCLGFDTFASWSEKKLEEMNIQLLKVADFYVDKLESNEDIFIDVFDGKFTSIIIDRENLFCSGGSKGHLNISSSGELYPCGFVINNNKWKIGTVNNGLDTCKLRKSIKSSIAKDIPCSECDIKFTCHARKCGFLNYAQTNYLNKPSTSTCNIEKIIYNVNKLVLKRLYKKNNMRIINLLNNVEQYNLKISKHFKNLIEL